MAKKPVKAETIFNSREDITYDDPVFGPGERVEFTADYPGMEGRPLIAAAGDAATVLFVNPTRDPSYSIKLDSQPEAKYPHTVSGRWLAPEGSGIRGAQEVLDAVNRSSGELRRH